MFVGSNNRREIYNNYFLNNKELPKGNKSERLVYLISRLFDNPKGDSAYKNIFDMSNENCQAPTKNEQSFNASNHHTQNFYKTIEDFYDFTAASELIEANNNLLNTYLEKAMDEGYCPKHIRNIVFTVTFQNQFITALKEYWELYKKFANPKIENV